MNRIARKFIAGISVILAAAVFCSILFYNGFLEKYYVYQKKKALDSICTELSGRLDNGLSADEAIEELEASHKVIVVKIDNEAKPDNDKVNDEIRHAFQDKGIGFQKYWLWEKDYEDILNGTNRIRLYNQAKLNYSLLIEYMYTDTRLFAVTMIIPDITDAFDIINTFLVFINAVTIILSILLITLLIRKITKPLQQFKRFACQMEGGCFTPLKIHTKDELEDVADSLNSMGNQIIIYQKSLQDKNAQMEQLLADVAHDLKTPISLIKLYAGGISDGLDDGSFLKTIVQQNSQLEDMVNKLLYLIRIDKEPVTLEACQVSTQLKELLNTYSMLARENKLEFFCRIEENIIAGSHKEWLNTILSNFITNAVKYASGTSIHIRLQKKQEDILFTISNASDNQALDISRIWEPYYVGEASRNKHLSGTGLGLSIVKKMAERLQHEVSCTFENQIITFTLTLRGQKDTQE